MVSGKLWKTVASILGMLVLLGSFAIYNRYPLLYSDLGTYLGSGFESYVPIDRPLTFGWLMRHLSLAESLIFSLVGQVLIVGVTLLLWFKHFLGQWEMKWRLLTTAGLCLLTSLSYQASLLIPDVYLSLAFLSSMILLLRKPRGLDLAWLMLVLIISIATHLSFGLIISVWGIAAVLGILSFKLLINRRNILLWGICVLIGILVLPITSWFVQDEFVASKGSSVFLFQKFRTIGIAHEFLAEECPNPTLELCDYEEELIECDFLWDYSRSPLYKMGGWDSTYQMFDSLNSVILSNPYYLQQFITEGLKTSVKQSVFWSLDPLRNFGDTGPMYYPIKKWMPELEVELYLQARQNSDGFDVKWLDPIHNAIYIVSILLSIFLFWKAPLEVKVIISITFLFLFSNALVCGVLGDLVSRYQNRVIWLLPLVVIWGLSRLDWTRLVRSIKTPGR